MTSIAITGGTGFIGRHLLARLCNGDSSVNVLTRKAAIAKGLFPHAKIFVGDLATGDGEIAEFIDGVDVLYHCAGEIADKSAMHSLHVGGTARLIAAAAGKVHHWVQLSSVGAYGQRRSGTVSEESPESPLGVYETTKTAADKLVTDAAARGAFTCTMLRPSTVFGNDMPNQSLAQWLAAIQRGWFFYIGKPGAVANYVHVDNVVDALLLCGMADAAKNRTYILSESMELEGFVKVVCEELGRPVPWLRLPEPIARAVSTAGVLLWNKFPLTHSRIDALTNRTVYSSAKITKELGYKPSVPLEKGLRDFVAHWKANGR
jgi:nucleoside-diphosphate-sugar epimerase